jgi:hypothetical protein
VFRKGATSGSYQHRGRPSQGQCRSSVSEAGFHYAVILGGGIGNKIIKAFSVLIFYCLTRLSDNCAWENDGAQVINHDKTRKQIKNTLPFLVQNSFISKAPARGYSSARRLYSLN